MKRALIVSLLAFLFWGITPAFANSVPSITIACDSVTVAWTSFPDHPVDLNVTVSQGDGLTVASVSTEGQTAGDGSVPVELANGTASATVSWTLQRGHVAGPVVAELTCTTTTSTTPTTSPPQTTVPSTVPLSTTTSTASPECGSETLPCTGSSSGTPIVVGLGLIVLGAGLTALRRRGTL